MSRQEVRRGGSVRGRHALIALAAAIAAVTLLSSACGADHTPATSPSAAATLLSPDSGWVAAGGTSFRPAPLGQAAPDPRGSTLIGATGSEARVKWVADRAARPGAADAHSRLVIRVADVTDPSAHATVELRGAGGAGFVDLPIEAGKRTVFRVSWTAVGTYARCAALIEVRTQ